MHEKTKDNITEIMNDVSIQTVGRRERLQRRGTEGHAMTKRDKDIGIYYHNEVFTSTIKLVKSQPRG